MVLILTKGKRTHLKWIQEASQFGSVHEGEESKSLQFSLHT
jgi:hypothetical protein